MNEEIKVVEDAIEEVAEDAVEVATKHSNGNIKYVALGSVATLAVIGVAKYGKRAFKWVVSKVKKTDDGVTEVSEDEIATVKE